MEDVCEEKKKDTNHIEKNWTSKRLNTFKRKPRIQLKTSASLHHVWSKKKSKNVSSDLVWPFKKKSNGISNIVSKKKVICKTTRRLTYDSAMLAFEQEESTKYHSLKIFDDTIHVGFSSTQGRRNYMEDRYIVSDELFSNCRMIGIYDGHNGAWAAEYASTRLGPLLVSNSLEQYATNPLKYLDEIYTILKLSFSTLDDEIIKWTKEKKQRDGTTALVLLFLDDLVFFANLGDTRAVRYHKNHTSRISVDHKPQHPAEKARIIHAGGNIIYSGCWRVTHPSSTLRLAISRALGDHPLKIPSNLISVVPHINHFKRCKGDILILASDGLWDRITDEEATNHVIHAGTIEKPNEWVKNASIQLIETALKRNTTDNVTVGVIVL